MKRNQLLAALVTVILAVAFNTIAVAQTAPPGVTKPTAPEQGNPERSNKGGQLRGLDRADRVAGEHGKQGRDTARDAQLNRPAHPVRPERPGR